MANNMLDLRMGIDAKLIDEEKSTLETGVLSYAVDEQNLYIDALREDQITTQRQMINANKAYAIRREPLKSQVQKNSDIVARAGTYGISSFLVNDVHDDYYFKTRIKLISKEDNVPIYYYENLEESLSWSQGDLFLICNGKKYILSNVTSEKITIYDGQDIENELIIGNSYTIYGYRVGNYSIAEGIRTAANGYASHACGVNSHASGNQSFCGGLQSSASGDNSFAFGNVVFTGGNNSSAFGNQTKATGNNSFSGGKGANAIGESSFAFGDQVKASGNNSLAFGSSEFLIPILIDKGILTTLDEKEVYQHNWSSDFSLAELEEKVKETEVYVFNPDNGLKIKIAQLWTNIDNFIWLDGNILLNDTNSDEHNSHTVYIINVEPLEAIGNYSVSIGAGTKANGEGSLAFGYQSKTDGLYSIALGEESQSLGDYSFSLNGNAIGDYSISINKGLAIGTNSISKLNLDTNNDGKTNNLGTKISGLQAGNRSFGDNSISIGIGNLSQGNSSITLGNFNQSLEIGSLAIGNNGISMGLYSTYFGYQPEFEYLKGDYSYKYTFILQVAEDSTIQERKNEEQTIKIVYNLDYIKGNKENEQNEKNEYLIPLESSASTRNFIYLQKLLEERVPVVITSSNIDISTLEKMNQYKIETTEDYLNFLKQEKVFSAFITGMDLEANTITLCNTPYADIPKDTLLICHYGGGISAGMSSFSVGWNTAYGDYSNSFGYENQAVGLMSSANGRSTMALGRQSFTNGLGTRAQFDNSTVIGKYNLSYSSNENVENINITKTFSRNEPIYPVTSKNFNKITGEISCGGNNQIWYLNKDNYNNLKTEGNIAFHDDVFIYESNHSGASNVYESYITKCYYVIEDIQNYTSNVLNYLNALDNYENADNPENYYQEVNNEVLNLISKYPNLLYGEENKTYFDANNEEQSYILYVIGEEELAEIEQQQITFTGKRYTYSPPLDKNYVFVVGNGENEENRSNAFSIDWQGNAILSGVLKADSIQIKNKSIFETMPEDSSGNQFITSKVLETELKKLVTDVWYIGTEPDQTKQKLLWIRIGNDYGNGVLYYYTGGTKDTDYQGWTPLSAIYS